MKGKRSAGGSNVKSTIGKVAKGGERKRRRPSAGREWDRMTELVALFSLTGQGYIITENGDRMRVEDSRPRPQSLILVSDPGQGKTEILERFRGNRFMVFQSDTTVRGVYRVLQAGKHSLTTHIIATELQKWLQRRASVYEQTFGALGQLMDEGLWDVSLGDQTYHFDGARLGLIAAMTHGSLDKRRNFLFEMGLLDRAAVLPWALPPTEKRDVLHRISKGDRSDLSRVVLPQPTAPVGVRFSYNISRKLEAYVWANWRINSFRMFTRFRSLAMAAAILDGRRHVEVKDVKRAVYQFEDYWKGLVIS